MLFRSSDVPRSRIASCPCSARPISGAAARPRATIAPRSCSRCCSSRGWRCRVTRRTSAVARGGSRRASNLASAISSSSADPGNPPAMWGSRSAEATSRTAEVACRWPRLNVAIHCATWTCSRSPWAGIGRVEPVARSPDGAEPIQNRLDTLCAGSLRSHSGVLPEVLRKRDRRWHSSS